MFCEICNKNPAKIHITQVKNNQKYTLHICHVCAHEKGVAGPAVNTSFSIEQILSGYQTAPEASAVETQVQSRTCPVCQLSYNAFKESGRLGCPVCYDTFSEHEATVTKDTKRNKSYRENSSSGRSETGAAQEHY